MEPANAFGHDAWLPLAITRTLPEEEEKMPKNPEKAPIYHDTVLPVSRDDLSTGKDLKKLSGSDLFQKMPHFFDGRLSEKQRFNILTNTQWQEYLDNLPCSLCGKKGGKCKCRPDELV
jgi:hypothetical protein